MIILIKKMAERTRKKIISKTTAPNRVSSSLTNFRNKIQNTSIKQRWAAVIILLILVLLYYYKNLFVVALVNGQPIPRLAVINQLEKDNGKTALDDLVTKTLILQEARKRNITITDKEINDEIKKVEDRVTKSGSNFDEALASQGLTRASLPERIRYSKLLQKLVEKDVQVTEGDINNFLAQNKASLPKEASGEALKQQAKDSVTQQKQQEKIQELITKLKKDAKINYFLNY